MSLDAPAPEIMTPPPVDMSDLSKVVGQTSFGIVEIAGVLDTVEANAKQQLDILQTVSAAATGVHTANSRVQDAIQGVVDRSDGTLGQVSNSVAQIREGALDAQHLAAWVSEVQDQVKLLNTALLSVKSDNSKIASIAANVNILAINASIEAARAGDAGRGFAVVAAAINDLSKKTTATASDISDNVASLSAKVHELKTGAEHMSEKAQRLENGAAHTDQALSEIAERVTETKDDAGNIAQQALSVQTASQHLLPGFDQLAHAARQTSQGVGIARKEAHDLIDDCELLVQMTADMGSNTPDTAIIALAQSKAAEIGAAFEAAVSRNLISTEQLFSVQYTALPHTSPQQVMAPFTTLTDRLLPAIQEPVLGQDPKIVFCAAVNRQGYLPTHNLKFSQKQSADSDWNAANCRNRRIFDDRVGLKSGQNTRAFLLQVYRRDMGGGAYKLMKDFSAPIFVNGRHWGGFRIGYAT